MLFHSAFEKPDETSNVRRRNFSRLRGLALAMSLGVLGDVTGAFPSNYVEPVEPTAVTSAGGAPGQKPAFGRAGSLLASQL